MQVFQHNGHAIHFADTGPRDGTPVLFSNSLGTDFRIWDPLLPHLPGGLRIIRYDKAGHGLSSFAGERGIGDHAGDVAALLDHLGIARAVIVGLSVGGMIAQALAAAHPDKVAALVLCDTGHRIGTAEIWNQRLAQIEAGGMEAVTDATMQRWFTRPFHDDPAFLAWRTMLAHTLPAGYCSVGRAIRDADYTAEAAGIAVPVLCIVGAEDGSTPPDLVRELAALIPGARFEQIEQCAHLPCIEQPQRLGALLAGFLARIA